MGGDDGGDEVARAGGEDRPARPAPAVAADAAQPQPTPPDGGRRDDAFADRAARTAFFARIDLLVNVLTLVFQVFLTSRILGALGVATLIVVLAVMNGVRDEMLKNLQKDSRDLKGRYDLLVDFCRDNLSAQSQVHEAVLRLVRARGLESLLEVLTNDLASLFDVDVVRLAVESDAPEALTMLSVDENRSGIVFIPDGLADEALGFGKSALMVEDVQAAPFPGLERIFAECASLVRSCILIRLPLEEMQRDVLLAFGVRHAGRFHPGQGIELLGFLADVLAHQLD